MDPRQALQANSGMLKKPLVDAFAGGQYRTRKLGKRKKPQMRLFWFLFLLPSFSCFTSAVPRDAMSQFPLRGGDALRSPKADHLGMNIKYEHVSRGMSKRFR